MIDNSNDITLNMAVSSEELSLEGMNNEEGNIEVALTRMVISNTAP